VRAIAETVTTGGIHFLSPANQVMTAGISIDEAKIRAYDAIMKNGRRAKISIADMTATPYFGKDISIYGPCPQNLVADHIYYRVDAWTTKPDASKSAGRSGTFAVIDGQTGKTIVPDGNCPRDEFLEH